MTDRAGLPRSEMVQCWRPGTEWRSGEPRKRWRPSFSAHPRHPGSPVKAFSFKISSRVCPAQLCGLQVPLGWVLSGLHPALSLLFPSPCSHLTPLSWGTQPLTGRRTHPPHLSAENLREPLPRLCSWGGTGGPRPVVWLHVCALEHCAVLHR